MSKLTPKQEIFIKEYLIDFNGTRAAIAAGYSKKTANRMAAENLTKPVIKEAIKKEKDKMIEKIDITKESIMQKLSQVIDEFLLDGNLTSNSLRAIEILNKMTGWNEPERKDITITEQPLFGPIDEIEDEEENE